MLQLTGVSKSYRDKTVIRNLTIAFPPTGVHFIAGENGAGKTTLFKCMTQLESYEGAISWNDGSVAGRISVAFEDSPLHDGLTGLQNLSAALDRTVRNVLADTSSANFLDMKTLAMKAKSYSFGQRKRLSLTAAFMQGTRCLILDEPTVALDASGLRVLVRETRAAAKSRCVIVSGHRLDFYSRVADPVLSGAESILGGCYAGEAQPRQ